MATERDPNVKNPEAPFTFINVFEIENKDVDTFIESWKNRSKVMDQMPGHISANLYQSILPNSKFQLINVAKWQSYNAWIGAVNDPIYSEQLDNDIAETPSLKINRGFYRPVASYTHLYD